jgi:hypothetical protein
MVISVIGLIGVSVSLINENKTGDGHKVYLDNQSEDE